MTIDLCGAVHTAPKFCPTYPEERLSAGICALSEAPCARFIGVAVIFGKMFDSDENIAIICQNMHSSILKCAILHNSRH